jgi:DNA-binding CsgD family transcriptional regulator
MPELPETLANLIDLAYISATDHLKWPEFLNEISHNFREANILLWHSNKNCEDFNITDSYGYSDSFMRSVTQHYHKINPWMQKKLLVPSGNLHKSEELFPDGDLVNTEFYNDLLRPNDLFKGFGISMYNDHRFAFLSLVRSRRAGPASETELRLLSLLTPHLQRAIQLHEQLLPVNGLGLTGSVLDQLGKGIIFVGRDLHVKYMNSAASKICTVSDGVTIDRNGYVRVWDVSAKEKLERAVQSIARTIVSSGGVISLERPSMRGPYALLVSRMPNIPTLASSSVAVALVLTDPDAKPATQARRLAERYGLTTAEVGIALQLSSGANLKTIGEELGISYETVRNHVKSIFAKTGTHRQAEVVALCNGSYPSNRRGRS